MRLPKTSFTLKYFVGKIGGHLEDNQGYKRKRPAMNSELYPGNSPKSGLFSNLALAKK